MSGYSDNHPTARLARQTQGKVATSLTCTDPRCAQPHTKRGPVPRGFVQVKAAREQLALWFCSWHCTSRHALRRELGGAA